MQQEQERPRVSIAMATYNGERFLPEQLESFLTQTRRPDELVVCSELFRNHLWRQRPNDFRYPGQPFSHDGRVVLLSQALGRVTFLHEALCLCRQHGGNAAGTPVHDWSKLVRKAPAVGFGAYRERARTALTCAGYLERLADTTVGATAEKLRTAATSYRRRVRLYWWRARVYHPLYGGRLRLREFALLNLRAAYRAASLGSLGRSDGMTMSRHPNCLLTVALK